MRRTSAAEAALRLLMAALLVTLCASVRAEAPALQLERTIPLPDVTGRIDHMAIDLGRRRLFVAELGNKAAHRIGGSQGTARHRLRAEGGCDRHCQCRRRIGYGEGGLATIDPASGSVVARAKPLRALRPTPPRRTIAWLFRRKTRARPSTVNAIRPNSERDMPTDDDEDEVLLQY